MTTRIILSTKYSGLNTATSGQMNRTSIYLTYAARSAGNHGEIDPLSGQRMHEPDAVREGLTIPVRAWDFGWT